MYNTGNAGYVTARRGFALPSIMIASVVMLLLLASAAASVTATRTALDEQYLNSLTRQAAESGVRLAEACVRENDMIVTWTSAKPLRPNTDCHGDIITGQSAYLLEEANIRTTFSVGLQSTTGGIYTISTEGSVERTRTSSGTLWKTSRQVLKAEISGETLYATSISSGLYQVCAVLSEQTWCNGGNQTGQMGNGRTEPLPNGPPVTNGGVLYLVPERVMRQSGALLERRDKLVASGTQATCTVTLDDEIYCWGNAGYGMLGIGTGQPNPQPTPTRVQKPAGMTGEITAIALGYHTGCAIAGGDLWCWGRDHLGQVGVGGSSRLQKNVPVRTAVIGAWNGRPVTNVAAHPYAHTICAVAGGEAYCWGDNTYGLIGDNTTSNRTVPTLVRQQSGYLLGKTVTDIDISLAPRVIDGQVGTTPTTPVSGGGTEVCAVATPHRHCYQPAHTCTSTLDGEMYCWGTNQYGQLGQGSWDLSTHRSPLRVLGLLNGKAVKDVATSYYTTCALTTEPVTNDRMFCWGGNNSGAGGLGVTYGCDTSPAIRQTLCSPAPVVMESPGLANRDIVSISAGVNRTCALADNLTFCSGLNTHGQLGDGTTTNRYTMVEARLFRQYRPSLVY